MPLRAAVEQIHARNAVTRDVARRALIATFMEGEATAICDAYWRNAIVEGRPLPAPAPEDNAVPADFWHLNHAELSPDEPGFVTSGYSGRWGEIADFRTEICLSSNWASIRFPEFEDLRALGGQPVDIEICAMDVRIFPVDLDALIERGKKRGKFEALLKRAGRKPAIVRGNVSKSDSERLLARLCCNFLIVAQQHQPASNPEKVLEMVRSTAANAGQDAAVSDRMMRRIANMIADEAQRLAERSGPPI